MKSEPAQVIDLALKSVNLLVLLARAICKRFSKISIPFKMLDLRPILASFMGDAQPSKNKQQQKKKQWKPINSVTLSPIPGEDIDSTGSVTEEHG